MITADLKIPEAAIDRYRRDLREKLERAALRTVDQVSRRGKSAIRQRFASAGLGRLGNAIGSDADERAVRRGADGFSASAQFFVRTRSERTLGALESYTQGADIRPGRGRWLWIATDQIPRRAGRQRMTPELWRQNGFDRKIGPLVLVKSVNGTPLLVVQGAGVPLSGKKHGARSLTKKGAARKGQVRREFLVAFIGIPRTARAARVNITAILNQVRAELPAIFENELRKEG